MTLRADGSAVPTERRSRAGRTLVALWVFAVVVVVAVAAWLQVLGPLPPTGTPLSAAGTTTSPKPSEPPAASTPRPTPEPPAAANTGPAPETPEPPSRSSGPAESVPKPPGR